MQTRNGQEPRKANRWRIAIPSRAAPHLVQMTMPTMLSSMLPKAELDVARCLIGKGANIDLTFKKGRTRDL